MKRTLAFIAVTAMLAICIVPMMDSSDADATPTTITSYFYNDSKDISTAKNRMLLELLTKRNVTARQICPCRMAFASKQRRLKASPVVSIIIKSQTAAFASTIHIISLGMPKRGWAQQNRSIRFMSFLTEIPSE